MVTRLGAFSFGRLHPSWRAPLFALLAVVAFAPLAAAQADGPVREREETRYRSNSSDPETRRERRRSRETKYLFNNLGPTDAYGAVFVDYAQIGGRGVTFTGGGGALLFDRRFFLGGYGQGLNGTLSLTPPADANLFGGEPGRFDMSHGGFWLGGVILPHAAVHPIVSTRIGWGGAEWEGSTLGRDYIFIVTPTVGIQANIASWMRVDLEVGYRFVDGLSLPGFTSTGLNGLNAGLTFKFGDFD